MTGSRLKLRSLIFLSVSQSSRLGHASTPMSTMKGTDTVTNPNQRNLRRVSSRGVECRRRMLPEGEAFRNARDTRVGVAFLIPGGSLEDWSRLDSVSDDCRSDWWFSFPLSRVLVTSSVGGKRLYRRCLAWELVWGRDQEATG